MRHDPFEWRSLEMTWWDKLWRVALLLFCIGAVAYDLLIGRPG